MKQDVKLIEQGLFISQWKQVLPIRIHTVQFEKLIDNPQVELSQILVYLGVNSAFDLTIDKPLDPNINQFQHYAKFYKPKNE